MKRTLDLGLEHPSFSLAFPPFLFCKQEENDNTCLADFTDLLQVLRE